MSEAITLKIVNSGVYNGATAIDLDKSSLGELGSYTATITEGGVIGSTILGLMTASSTKLISIAGEVNGYPGARVTVTGPDSPANPREEITLQSRFQRVVVAGGEVLRIFWSEETGRSGVVRLLIQDLAEQECTPVMRVEHRPKDITTRYHILFQGGGAGAGGVNPGPNNFGIHWAWDPALKIFRSTFPAPAAGHLDISNLTFESETAGRGVYVWVKCAGSPLSEVGTQNWASGENLILYGGLKPDTWANPIWVSSTDRLIFRVPPPALGTNVSVDLEVSPLRTRILQNVYK